MTFAQASKERKCCYCEHYQRCSIVDYYNNLCAIEGHYNDREVDKHPAWEYSGRDMTQTNEEGE